jgi:OOP family OmpA-OmpF porin
LRRFIEIANRYVRSFLLAILEQHAGSIDTMEVPRSVRAWWRTLRLFRAVHATRASRVELILLIHRETGLLLKHAARRGTAFNDLDSTSAMMMAIVDFTRSSFDGEDSDSLNSFTAGDVTVCLESGPCAVLAGVVRGAVPTDLRERLRFTIDQIHSEFGAHLRAFSGEADAFEPTSSHLNPFVQDITSASRAG